jgi:hypothetical protein
MEIPLLDHPSTLDRRLPLSAARINSATVIDDFALGNGPRSIGQIDMSPMTLMRERKEKGKGGTL